MATETTQSTESTEPQQPTGMATTAAERAEYRADDAKKHADSVKLSALHLAMEFNKGTHNAGDKVVTDAELFWQWLTKARPAA